MDTIEREAALKAVHEAIAEGKSWYSALSNLPSAEKTGKWIEQDDEWGGVYYECSVCKEAFTLIDGTPTDNLYNYCPNCGASMMDEVLTQNR